MSEIICGIYKITNLRNGKMYIGQSIDIYNRWLQHYHNINKKNHRTLLSSAMKSYGFNNFQFEIIEECSIEELNEKEIYYIQKYNTYYLSENSNGYNMTLGGDGQRGLGIQVHQYDMQGNYIESFSTAAEASRITGTDDTGILLCCRGKRNSANGFLWSYEKFDKISPYKEKGTPIKQYDLDGNFIKVYPSISIAAKDNNTTKTNISNCCNEKSFSTAGYRWSFLDKKPNNHARLGEHSSIKVDQYTLDGMFIQTFNSCSEAANYITSEERKISKGQISDCCKKDNHSAAGYLWRFHGDNPPKPYVDRYYCPILQYTLDKQFVQEYDSLNSANKATGISSSSILCALTKKYKQAGGFIWEYK